MGHYLSEMESDAEYRRRMGLPPQPTEKTPPVADRRAELRQALAGDPRDEYGYLLIHASGRCAVVPTALHANHPCVSFADQMMKYERRIAQGDPQHLSDPLVEVQLVHRPSAKWRIDKTFTRPSVCLSEFGGHDFQGSYAAWTSKCSRCGIFQ